ncbi:MAG: adenosylcobinamide-GDP ribazoletransferase [Lentisphaerae bacterium]|nr:adenosylcobinamide-GDP ribazoletransferase [Lentisphaerota bacterium]
MLNSLVTAIRTLTIFPIPGKDTDDLASALPWFPLIGLLIGSLLYGIAIISIEWTDGLAVLVIVAEVILTRGLHLDGFADWADGFWGGKDKESVLRIMKDPSVGAFGAIALICAILAQWACYVCLIETNSQVWIIAACVLSRTMQVVLTTTNSYARDTTGTAAPFIENARFSHMAIAIAAASLIILVIGQFNWMWLGVLAIAWFPTRIFGAVCKRRIDGITGDLLGAANQIVEILILAVGCFITSSN